MTVPVIEGYTDVVQVAQGGFGIVYRARREALDQDVAIKVLSLPNLSERDLDRFTRECRAAGNLSWHPHVVAVTDSGTTSTGQPYLTMEYLDNGSLADRLIADGPLPWAEVVDIGIQVAGALGAAHTAGTLHRDLKPENVLVGHFGEAKLGDFGIAAVEGSTRTATGHASYTVTHVAPEILRGQRPDERSDLYGLASTLFTLLAGRTPFAGDDPDEPIATIITRALTEPAPHLTGIPKDLADLLEQTLDKDPDQRPQTAEALGQGLQQLQRDEGLPVTDLRLARTTRTSQGPSPEATSGDSSPTITVAPAPEVPNRSEEPPANGGDPNATITVAPPPQDPPTDEPSVAKEPPTIPPPATPPAAESRRSRTPLFVGLGALVVLVLGAGAFVVLRGDEGASPSTTSSSSSTSTPDAQAPVTHRLSGSADVEGATAVAVDGFGGAWVTDFDGQRLTRLEGTGSVSQNLVLTNPPLAIATQGAQVWVASGAGGRQVDDLSGEAARINQISDLISARVPVGPIPDLAASPSAVWVTSSDGRLFEIDPDEGAVVSTFDFDGSSSSTVLAATDDAVWIASTTDPTLVRIDPATGTEVTTLALPAPATGIAAAGDDVWIIGDRRELTHVDGSTDEVSDPINVPGSGRLSSIAATVAEVWVGDRSGSLVQIDPNTQDAIGGVEVAPGDELSSIAIDDPFVWTVDRTAATVHRISPR